MNSIWIRSQDKKMLVYVIQVFIMYNGCVKGIYAGVNEAVETLGKYITEIRALQVLEEIQRAICYIKRTELLAIKMDGMSDEDMMQFVFEMPAE